MRKRGNIHNHSPWIYQLKNERKIVTLKGNHKTDVVIIGAGIAGIMTAFFILNDTKKKVSLIEGGRIAHGATGHNAGQIAPYFEKPFSDLVHEFGLKKAAEGQNNVIDAWNLLNEVYKIACLETPKTQFIGHAGCSSIEQVIEHLKNKHLREKAGISMEKIMISDEVPKKAIPSKYRKLYKSVPHASILNLLETSDTKYIACLSTKKGCMNSALFCEELTGYMLSRFKKRFKLFENTHVKEVILSKDNCTIKALNHSIFSNKVILCTNGFESVKIVNLNGENVDKRFHELIHGIVGFMAGYVEHKVKTPTAISYFKRKSRKSSDPYFYMTRRFFEKENETHHTLICVGGPEMPLAEKSKYQKNANYSPKAYEQIDKFLRKTYHLFPCSPMNYRFKWHGLMGYTKTGVRCIGFEPLNTVLMYNLGCNGVGILPSIYGAKKISLLLQGKKFKPSIFDPQSKENHKELISQIKKQLKKRTLGSQ